ncbi:MAG: RHS repeat protein, partial [Candidatus Omnitrophica bacterium]|nr:RHS repeat protein [Candidatus Omnitrophota bacterium]
MKKVFHLIILTAFFVQSVCPAWALNQRQPGESRILSVQEMKSVKGGNQSPADGSAKQGECSTAQRIPCEPNGKDGGDSQQPTDPVMLTGGKFYLPYVDVEIPGLGRETGNNLRFNRSYSSQSSYRGVLGTGWVTILDIALIDFGGGGFFLRDWDGSVFHFTYDETEDVFRDGEMTLVDSGSEWVLTKVHGTKYVFEGPNQKLLYIEDVNGNRLTFEYFQYDLGNPDSTHVKRIVDSSGQFLSFEQQYEAEVSVFPDSVLITHIFRLRSMSDHTGRTWQYQWDQEDKHLMSVIDPLGRIMSYQYAQQDPDDPILVDTNNITAVTDFNGNATLYTYDTQTDRVITMTSADNTIKKFEFNSAAGTSLDTSTMTDENGREWKYEYTLRGLTTAIIDPRNHTKQYEYDPDSNLMIVSRDELNRQTEY